MFKGVYPGHHTGPLFCFCAGRYRDNFHGLVSDFSRPSSESYRHCFTNYNLKIMNANEVVKCSMRVFEVNESDIKRERSTKEGAECVYVISHLLHSFAGMKDKDIGDLINKSRSAISISRYNVPRLMSKRESFREKYYAIQDACYLNGWL